MQNPSSIPNPVVQVLGQQAWPRTIKLQSQTTFNGKESENIENWLSLLVLNFELVKLHSDDWIGVAATYLRENALKLYMSKKSSLNMTDWKSFADFLTENYGTKNYTNILLEK